MGELEFEALRERRRGYMKSAVLGTLAVTGIVAVALVAPNTLQLLKHVKINGRRLGDQARTALGRLAREGHVEFVMENGRKYARITPTGRHALMQLEERARLKARSQRRWDKRYRVVIFDIPEKKRKIRDQLRSRMHEAGFLQLQQSVWIHPHDCEDLVALVKADLHIGKAVLYLIVEKIEHDAWVRQHFGLPHA
ncbi:MAG: CRISPR-associated endonuclease Cas2 [Patescibacteria group bacterium]